MQEAASHLMSACSASDASSAQRVLAIASPTRSSPASPIRTLSPAAAAGGPTAPEFEPSCDPARFHSIDQQKTKH